jgi:hypothetical protein
MEEDRRRKERGGMGNVQIWEVSLRDIRCRCGSFSQEGSSKMIENPSPSGTQEQIARLARLDFFLARAASPASISRAMLSRRADSHSKPSLLILGPSMYINKASKGKSSFIGPIRSFLSTTAVSPLPLSPSLRLSLSNGYSPTPTDPPIAYQIAVNYRRAPPFESSPNGRCARQSARTEIGRRPTGAGDACEHEGEGERVGRGGGLGEGGEEGC